MQKSLYVFQAMNDFFLETPPLLGRHSLHLCFELEKKIRGDGGGNTNIELKPGFGKAIHSLQC